MATLATKIYVPTPGSHVASVADGPPDGTNSSRVYKVTGAVAGIAGTVDESTPVVGFFL